MSPSQPERSLPFPGGTCPLCSDTEQKQLLLSFVLEGRKPEFCEKLESIGHIKMELLWGSLCKSAAERCRYILKQFNARAEGQAWANIIFKHFKYCQKWKAIVKFGVEYLNNNNFLKNTGPFLYGIVRSDESPVKRTIPK